VFQILKGGERRAETTCILGAEVKNEILCLAQSIGNDVAIRLMQQPWYRTNLEAAAGNLGCSSGALRWHRYVVLLNGEGQAKCKPRAGVGGSSVLSMCLLHFSCTSKPAWKIFPAR